MSKAEILEEIPKLTPDEREEIRLKIEELAKANGEEGNKTVWDVLHEFAGSAENLPSDISVNHDHYLYGGPKRQP
jgi:hypothetical protein